MVFEAPKRSCCSSAKFQVTVAAGSQYSFFSVRPASAVGENAFASVPEALGALYSFEVQQPTTASSKLDGLREHYAGTVDADAQQYFVEHAVETDEPAMLAARIDALSDGEFARAKTACT